MSFKLNQLFWTYRIMKHKRSWSKRSCAMNRWSVAFYEAKLNAAWDKYLY